MPKGNPSERSVNEQQEADRLVMIGRIQQLQHRVEKLLAQTDDVLYELEDHPEFSSLQIPLYAVEYAAKDVRTRIIELSVDEDDDSQTETSTPMSIEYSKSILLRSSSRSAISRAVRLIRSVEPQIDITVQSVGVGA